MRSVVVSVKDKELSHGAGESGSTSYPSLGTAKHICKKFAEYFSSFLIDERLADGIFVSHRGNGRHFPDHADTCHLTLRWIPDID